MLTLKNKIISVGSALSKQIPLKVNGFAETKNFQHLLRKISRKPKGIAKIWNFLHLQSLVETGPIESQWICRNKEFPTPVSCLKTYPGYLG